MSMWFYDDAGEMAEYQVLRREVRALEREYLELRVLLREAEEALRGDPEDEYLTAKVKYLTKRLKDLEKKHPWFSRDYPVEVALWAPPHG